MLAALAVAGGLSVAAAIGVGRLQFDDRGLTAPGPGDPQFAAMHRLIEDFGSDEAFCLVLLEGERLFSSEGAAALREIVAEAGRLEGVAWVGSPLDVLVVEPSGAWRPLIPPDDAEPADFARARADAAVHPAATGQLVSEDGRTALILVGLEGGRLPIDEAERLIARLRAIVHPAAAEAGLEGSVTGTPVVRVEIARALDADLWRPGLFGGIASLACGLLLFGRVGPALAAAAVPALGCFWTLGAMGLAGRPLHLANAQLPVVILVLGYAWAAPLVVEASRANESLKALSGSAPAFVLLLWTFGYLGLSEGYGLRDFGWGLLCGLVMTAVAAGVVLPLLVAWRGDREARPVRCSAGRWFVGQIANLPKPRQVGNLPHMVVLAVVGIAACLLAARIETGVQFAAALPKSGETYRALDRYEEVFGGMSPVQIVVRWPKGERLDTPRLLELLDQAQRILAAKPGVHRPASINNVLECLPPIGEGWKGRAAWLPLLPRSIVRYSLRMDRRCAVVGGRVRANRVAAMETTWADLDRELGELRRRYPEFGIELTGPAVLGARAAGQLRRDLLLFAGLAAGTALAGLWIVVRRFRLAFVGMLAAAIPVPVAALPLVVSGQPMGFAGAAALLTAWGLGLLVTIPVLARFRSKERWPADVSPTDGQPPPDPAAIAEGHVIGTLVVVAACLPASLATIGVVSTTAMMIVAGAIAATSGGLSCGAFPHHED